MHIHLDLVGGLSGDMFAGAILDCFPDLAESLSEQLVLAGFRDLVDLTIEPFDDGVLTGTRFRVSAATDAEGHHHRHYSEIRDILSSSKLDEDTKSHALAIFLLIAEVEAKIHGKEVDAVAFHEVGAWDSIADVVCAASLISALGATSWSVSPVPAGRGMVKTAHGMLPLPAPATALLLEGFQTTDDGLEGERVTPTGAAILRHLAPGTRRPNGQLDRTGYGFGTRKFPGISNVARALVLTTESSSTMWAEDEVLELEFEIDDQTPEELADALDRLRALDDTIDVSQQQVTGKKGRHAASIRILARPTGEHSVLAACFDETTTLGIRKRTVTRAILFRREEIVGDVRIKVADRPGGVTAKAEHDDIAGHGGTLAKRRDARADAEHRAPSNKPGKPQ